jgi:hypothetical protein
MLIKIFLSVFVFHPVYVIEDTDAFLLRYNMLQQTLKLVILYDVITSTLIRPVSY